jgi:energy-coupling factor transporter ATP-binding protein EcfA2
MSVTVQNLDGENKRRVESRLDQVLKESDLDDLTVSPLCAHVILESARSLKAKEDANWVLSSSTIFLTAMLFSIRLADEGLPDIDAAELKEQATLRNWGAVLRNDYSEVVESLVAEFFANPPRPARSVFENLADEPPSKIQIGPSLSRTLKTAAEAGPLTAPDMLLHLARDEQSGIAERLREKQAQKLTDSLLESNGDTTDSTDATSATATSPDPEVPQGWRHAHMFREAEHDELVLGVGAYAKAIATVLRAAKGEFTFALLGRWGSGKTTLVSQLEPLLRDADAYRRAIGAPANTREHYARRSYRVVMHNAWKYPSRPEAWVYAYKSLADEASRGFGPLGRLLLAIRTSVHRRGLWPIAGALMTLALLALPLTAKLQLAVMALSVAGFSTMVYLGAVASSVSGKVRALFAKHLRLTQVDERLGMLALIGDDVRALLAGWTVPKGEDRSRRGFQAGKLFLPLLALVSVAVVWLVGLSRSGLEVPKASTKEVLAGLVPDAWAEAIGPLWNATPLPPSNGEWLVFYLWLIIAFCTLVLPWLWRFGRPNRVLMVIDDLDRCSATEMLDVIEGMKLLVDDSTVNNRLQVMMLIDESVLNHAIAKRYAAMIEDRISHFDANARKAARAAARDEVTMEQNEKLFACHLRLAPLSEADVTEVVGSLAGREPRQFAQDRLRRAEDEVNSTEKEYQRILSGAAEFAPTDELQDPTVKWQSAEDRASIADVVALNKKRALQTQEERLRDNPEVIRARENAAREKEEAAAEVEELGMSADDPVTAAPALFQKDADVRFTGAEVRDLRAQVPTFLKALNRRPSPRAIRILLFKVQLCRLLLQTRYPGQPGERTVAKILEAFREASETPEPVAGERAAVTIARQVI